MCPFGAQGAPCCSAGVSMGSGSVGPPRAGGERRTAEKEDVSEWAHGKARGGSGLLVVVAVRGLLDEQGELGVLLQDRGELQPVRLAFLQLGDERGAQRGADVGGHLVAALERYWRVSVQNSPAP